MIKNYLQVAIRNILKQKVYSLINVLGLAIGLTASILIFMNVMDETSFDNYHPNANRIYKIFLERLYPDHVTNYAVIPHSYAEVIPEDIPGVVKSVRLAANNIGVQVTYINEETDEKVSFEEEGIVAADSTFFDIFELEFISGSGSKVFEQPQTVVMSESMAQKYFDDSDPIGKTILLDFFGQFTIQGVYTDIPDNSHFELNFIASATGFYNNENFLGFDSHTYLLLDKNADPMEIESKIPDLVDKYAAGQIEQTLNQSYKDYVAAGNGYNYKLVNIQDIHLDSTPYQNSFKPSGDKNDVFIFISLAFLILIIASINFTNLAVARSTERAKEVGIRKTMGSYKAQLIGQFLTESIIISFISLLVAISLVYIFLPGFNNLIGKSLIFTLNFNSILILLGVSLVIGLMAGSYPAFFMSSFNTISVLKGGVTKGKGSNWLRNGLVILQFTISITLIIGTLIISDQMNFIRNREMGFDKTNMLVIERSQVLNTDFNSFKLEIEKLPMVKHVASSNAIPANQYFGTRFMPQGSTESLTTNAIFVDDQFLETVNLQLLEGKSFSQLGNDSLNVIINEQTAKLLDTSNPIGLKLRNIGVFTPQEREFTIIGIVKDFHYMSLREKISPFVLFNKESISLDPNFAINYITVKIDGNMQDAISSIEAKWNELANKEPFKYTFLDDELNELYKSEANAGKRLTVFSILAIIIACIGLFGLSAYTSGLRIKEIGIRKVLGASVGRIVFILTTDFTKLVLIAFVIAVPIGYFGMNIWLNNFAYKTSIGFDIFIYSGLAALAISFITVSYQTIRAALINPVNSLRNE